MNGDNHFLDFQLRRIRFALYQAYRYKQVQLNLGTSDEIRESGSIAWHEIAASVNNASGAIVSEEENKNFGERIRAFVIGNKQRKTGSIIRTVPKRINEIVHYLLQEETYLKKSELENFQPDQQAAVRLQEFLDSEYTIGSDANSEPKGRSGKYISYSFLENSTLEVKLLCLEYEKYTQHFSVQEFTYRFDCANLESDSIKSLRDKLLSTIVYDHLDVGDQVYTGWAVNIFDGNFIVFLKDQETDRNKFYLTLYFDPKELENKNSVNRLVLVERFSPTYHLTRVITEDGSTRTRNLSELDNEKLVKELGRNMLSGDIKNFSSYENLDDAVTEILQETITRNLKENKTSDSINSKNIEFMFLDNENEQSVFEESISTKNYEFENWEELANVYIEYTGSGSVDPREIVREIFRVAKANDYIALEKYLAAGLPLDIQDKDNGFGILHAAASGGAIDVIQRLIKTGKCDFLIQNRKRLYASDVAYQVADNYELASQLHALELEQAKKHKSPYRNADGNEPFVP